MNENEFEVLDHLYFVTSFTELQELSGLEETVLKQTLIGLVAKDWVKCLIDPDNEITVSEEDLQTNYANYLYLATKKGLLEHNLR